jgi:hypothetical protein
VRTPLCMHGIELSMKMHTCTQTNTCTHTDMHTHMRTRTWTIPPTHAHLTHMPVTLSLTGAAALRRSAGTDEGPAERRWISAESRCQANKQTIK